MMKQRGRRLKGGIEVAHLLFDIAVTVIEVVVALCTFHDAVERMVGTVTFVTAVEICIDHYQKSKEAAAAAAVGKSVTAPLRIHYRASHCRLS